MTTMARMQALLALVEAVSGARTTTDLYDAALDFVEHALGIERAAILLFDADGVVRFKAWRGLSDRYRATVEGHSPWGPQTKDARPVEIADIAADESLGELRDVVLAEGIQALAFIPLQAQGQLLGKVMLYHPVPHASAPGELREAQAVADQIAMAIERRRAEDQVRELNTLLGGLMQHVLVGVVYVDDRRKVRYANDVYRRMFGAAAADGLVGLDYHDMFARIHDQFVGGAEVPAHILQLLGRDGTVRDLELRLLDGRVLEASIVRLGEPGTFHGHLCQFVDVTARRELEAQLLQAHKMESIGRLAGGVAHDFNNLLTAVIGYVDLALAGVPRDQAEHGYLRQALEAAEQASGLTRQLLTFARRQPVQAVVHDLNELVTRLAPMLRRLTPENIALEVRTHGTPCWVRTDVGQLEQVLVNLVLNARDAMPDGGTLTLETGHESRGAAAMARLVVTDTGVGMDAEMLGRVFEPFYTTKEMGRGTGLGLATVYGVVHQCGGDIQVSSEPGRGARFSIVLPMHAAPTVPAASLATPGGEGETVLLVEDDASVRGLVTVMLQRLGYHALAADDADAALRLAQEYPGAIHALLTDVVMPGMSGLELARRLSAKQPSLRVLLMSGYTPSAPEAVGDPPSAFLPKPFSIEVLGARLRETLGAKRSAGVPTGAAAL